MFRESSVRPHFTVFYFLLLIVWHDCEDSLTALNCCLLLLSNFPVLFTLCFWIVQLFRLPTPGLQPLSLACVMNESHSKLYCTGNLLFSLSFSCDLNTKSHSLSTMLCLYKWFMKNNFLNFKLWYFTVFYPHYSNFMYIYICVYSIRPIRVSMRNT